MPVHEFEWVAERYTIDDPITSEDTTETPLPPPSKLNAISFLDLDQKKLGVEFGRLSTCSLLHTGAFASLNCILSSYNR